MVDDDVKAIREYVWAKYVDYAHVDEIDEAKALVMLERYHRSHPIAVDGETYYLGILYFEQAFLKADSTNLFLARAHLILSNYRDRSGEDDWDAIVDRIEEAHDALADMDDGARDKLLAKVLKEVDAMSDAASEAVDEDEVGPQVVDGMVFVGGGSFLSGPTNQPRDVKAFWIDEFPVTNAEYKSFVESTGYRSPKFWNDDGLKEPEAPVVGVSWYDAFKFAAFAGKSLPTKDEWEKAVRGTKGQPYPWDGPLDPEKANYGNSEDDITIARNGAHPDNVSVFGVREAIGNVWEWTDSPDPADSEQRVICGGSWCDPESFVRVDQHLAAYPKDKYDNIGFRCARVAAE